MRRLLLLSVVFAVALTSSAQKKKKPELPQAVLVAQYVYVTGWHGDATDLRVPPQERAAIAKVQAALDQWHRYRVVNSPTQADLMLVVRVGNLGLTKGGPGIGGVDMPPGTVGVGIPSPGGRTGVGGPYGGADIGSDSDDMLMVSLNPQESPDDAPAIWQRRTRNGFMGRPSLVEEFKKSVEQSEKAIADSKKP